jgi:hypothetical protein
VEEHVDVTSPVPEHDAVPRGSGHRTDPDATLRTVAGELLALAIVDELGHGAGHLLQTRPPRCDPGRRARPRPAAPRARQAVRRRAAARRRRLAVALTCAR